MSWALTHMLLLDVDLDDVSRRVIDGDVGAGQDRPPRPSGDLVECDLARVAVEHDGVVAVGAVVCDVEAGFVRRGAAGELDLDLEVGHFDLGDGDQDRVAAGEGQHADVLVGARDEVAVRIRTPILAAKRDMIPSKLSL